jgi:malate synthase
MNAETQPRVYSREPAGPKVEILGADIERADEVLTPLALQLLASLHRRFNARRLELLDARAQRQTLLDDGALPQFLAATQEVRAADWRIAPIPADLIDRRVEITGPVDRKMIINALNAPVRAFMADFEDSCSPTWENLIRGQVNLMDAVRRTISYADRQGLSARGAHGHPDRAPARLAPAGEARAHQRRGGVRRPVRLCAVSRQQP